jgi:hypothetical protein
VRKDLLIADPITVLKNAHVIHGKRSLVYFRIVEAKLRNPLFESLVLLGEKRRRVTNITDVNHNALIHVALGSSLVDHAENMPVRSHARPLLDTEIVHSPEKVCLELT